MLFRRSALLVIALMLLSVQQSYSQTDRGNAAGQLNQKLFGMVKSVLEGTNIGQAKEAINRSAYLIDGVKYESLYAVVNGESKDCKIDEGKQVRYTFENLLTSNDGTAAFMVLKTSSPTTGEHFHSIVFFHEPNAGWKIVSWHISK